MHEWDRVPNRLYLLWATLKWYSEPYLCTLNNPPRAIHSSHLFVCCNSPSLHWNIVVYVAFRLLGGGTLGTGCVIMHASVSLPLSSLGFIGLQLGYFFGQARRDYVILERNNISGWLGWMGVRSDVFLWCFCLYLLYMASLCNQINHFCLACFLHAIMLSFHFSLSDVLYHLCIIGSFYTYYPRHRTLISINKRFTGTTNYEFNLRHDWNSLISNNRSLEMRHYTKEYFPGADTYVRPKCVITIQSFHQLS